MNKKKEFPKLSPGDSLRSLQAYHEAVVLLVNVARLSINHLQQTPAGTHCAQILKENIAAIEEFYNSGS